MRHGCRSITFGVSVLQASLEKVERALRDANELLLAKSKTLTVSADHLRAYKHKVKVFCSSLLSPPTAGKRPQDRGVPVKLHIREEAAWSPVLLTAGLIVLTAITTILSQPIMG